MEKMFCFQCEQTAGGKGCTINGVCGKKGGTANLQDELTGVLIGLSRATIGNKNRPTSETDKIMIEGLFTTITNVSFDDEAIKRQIEKTEVEKSKLVPRCSDCSTTCNRNDNYDMKDLWNDNEDIRSLKSLILFGLRGMAAYAYHAMVLGYTDKDVNEFFYEGLIAVGGDLSIDELLGLVMKTGEINLKCMELLDRANTETYGTPEPTQVSMKIEKGPFIVVTGHDLYDLHKLLEQIGRAHV